MLRIGRPRTQAEKVSSVFLSRSWSCQSVSWATTLLKRMYMLWVYLLAPKLVVIVAARVRSLGSVVEGSNPAKGIGFFISKLLLYAIVRSILFHLYICWKHRLLYLSVVPIA